MPRVSIVMASYNHERFVGKAVQSVLDQSLSDLELVITDDASTDGTAAVIERFTDPRVRFLRFAQNRGQYVAVNHCLRAARGEYVGVLNSDDVYLPTKLALQVAFLDAHPEVGAVFGRVRTIDGADRPVRSRKHFLSDNRSRFEWLNRFFYKDNRLCHPSALLRRRCHQAAGGYDARYAQLADYDLWTRMCLRCDIHILPDEVVAFRWHGANQSGRRPDSIRRRWWEHRQILDNFLAIDSLALLQQVFPEAKPYGDDLDADLIPFVLAQLALQSPSRRQVHQAFALDTLFRLLRDPARAERLEQRFGFGPKGFTRLTAQYDVFNVFAVRQMRVRPQRGPAGLWKKMLRRLPRFGSGD
jgi:glycosyltransferase involved in cell wall biosynthesis